MLGNIPVGAGEEYPVIGLCCSRVPYLLARYDPLVSVQLSTGRQSGKIRPCPRFAEELTPHDFSGGGRSEEAALEVVASMLEQGWYSKVHPHRFRRSGNAEVGERLGDGLRQGHREPSATPLGGPRGTGPSCVDQPGSPLKEAQVWIPVGLQPPLEFLAHICHSHTLIARRSARKPNLMPHYRH